MSDNKLLTEKKALMCVDLQRECNPDNRKFHVVTILGENTLEVAK
tara:strand:+ start:340 stop:474 length:135 start_codon:yes stop_codon:yes gene_type:complete